jgi:hypothetical protein
MESMLQFQPLRRTTFSQALNNPYFDELMRPGRSKMQNSQLKWS